MANEAGCESSPSLASSSVHPSGDTRHKPPLRVPAGSYELQDWPGKARNIATSETSSDDDLDLSADPSENSPRFIKKAMSRVPLLVRSSPAQGTGKLIIATRHAITRLSASDMCTGATMHTAHEYPFTARADCTSRVVRGPSYSFFEPRRRCRK